MSTAIEGWLLDVYANSTTGASVWLLGIDGRRYHLHYPMQATWYVTGPFSHLRIVWKQLKAQPISVELNRTRREDLNEGWLDVMLVRGDVATQRGLFHKIWTQHPELDYFDADIPVSVRFAAQTAVFPTMRCQFTVDDNTLLDITPTESRWDIVGHAMPLRVMTMEPNVNPSHRQPTHLTIGGIGQPTTYTLDNGRLLLIALQARLKRLDPDLIMTKYGDAWLFPYLRQLAHETGSPFHPSRDEKRPYDTREANSYFTYGMVLHRSAQTYLYGRWHIDIKNALLFNEYDVSGVLEQSRLSGMPVQEMARRSPGAGITAMQMITALKRGVLVPYTKQQSEYYKSNRELIRSDKGGMVYQPQLGLHTDVIELDFVSMYPSIISQFNVSPETVKVNSEHVEMVPELNIPIDQSKRGLLPETLHPLLVKRKAIKEMMSQYNAKDAQYKTLKSLSTAIKWLLVVSFGYAGYKRAKFGRIEAHESITAYSREALLRAKEVAEAMGYEIMHLYVDGMWVKRQGVKTVAAIQPLIEEIERATKLPIALEGFYKWIAFLPSKLNAQVPVPNRFFGVFETGEQKIRGIELRRHDTPRFVGNIQQQILNELAKSTDINDSLNHIIDLVRAQFAKLRAQQIAPDQLIVTQILSKEIEEYRVPSPAARAAMQLRAAEKERFPGQRIGFIYTRGHPGVHAWDLPQTVDIRTVDVDKYIELTIRAVDTLLQPWGIKKEWLSEWFLQDWFQAVFYLPKRGRDHATLSLAPHRYFPQSKESVGRK